MVPASASSCFRCGCLPKCNCRVGDNPGTTPIQDPGTFGRPPTVVSSKPPSISALVCLPWLGVGRPTENQNSDLTIQAQPQSKTLGRLEGPPPLFRLNRRLSALWSASPGSALGGQQRTRTPGSISLTANSEIQQDPSPY